MRWHAVQNNEATRSAVSHKVQLRYKLQANALEDLAGFFRERVGSTLRTIHNEIRSSSYSPTTMRVLLDRRERVQGTQCTLSV